MGQRRLLMALLAEEEVEEDHLMRITGQVAQFVVMQGNLPPVMRLPRAMPQFEEDICEVFMAEHFRFTVPRLRVLVRLVGLPWDQMVTGPDQRKMEGRDVAAMLLFVLSTSKRVIDCALAFGISPQSCSRWLIWSADLFYHRLRRYSVIRWHVVRPRLHLYARAVNSRTDGMLTMTCGFIDGHNPPIARPSTPGMQRQFYSGKRKLHCISVQGVCFPDGLVAVSDPVPGRLNDLNLYDRSGISEELREHLQYDADMHGGPDGVQPPDGWGYFHLLGDAIYIARRRPWLISHYKGYRNVPLLDWQLTFNSETRTARADVEHAFAQVALRFSGHRMKWWVRTMSSTRFLQTYSIAFALFNLLTVMQQDEDDFGNQISKNNNLRPPTLEEFVA